MIIREATIDDIKQIQIVRNSVKENTLSDPNLVTDEDCKEYITVRGKGWVCEIDRQIVGFAIADLKENNIWALFLHPKFEGKGIGKKLLKTMLDWYFTRTKDKVWLGTAPDTRAEKFYRNAGWREVGTHGTKEIKFEMTYNDWANARIDNWLLPQKYLKNTCEIRLKFLLTFCRGCACSNYPLQGAQYPEPEWFIG